MNFRDRCPTSETPKSELNFFGKKRSGIASNSPFRNMPNVSTPPSRFSKIINPFENHLIERLHLPTFSPSVFAKGSTPIKSEEKFKWTIEDISSLKPAEIDEATVSQHVLTEDPHVESVVQQKIETFFSETSIVPSPFNKESKPVLLIRENKEEHDSFRNVADSSTQTLLSLPPQLPQHVAEVLRPYFMCNDDQQTDEQILSQKLFNFECSPEVSEQHTARSSLSLFTDLSPIKHSSVPLDRSRSSYEIPQLKVDIPQLDECNLSPISKVKDETEKSKSVCRLNFSSKMSVDGSFMLPPLETSGPIINDNVLCIADVNTHCTKDFNESYINWDMEYNHVLVKSPIINDVEKMDFFNSSTPHSRIFTSQRKRLSDSFESDDDENIERESKSKIPKNNVTDVGYYTETKSEIVESLNWNSSMYASTPTKQ